MTIQDTSTSRGRKTWILGAGLVAIAAIVAYLGFDYPPASDDAAGTIVPANRYRADANSGAPTGDEADQVATSDVGAIQSEAMDAAVNSKAAVGKSGDALVTSKANVGKSSDAALNRAAVGKSGDAAVNSKAAVGKSGDAAVNSRAAVGKSGDAAVNSKAAAGKSNDALNQAVAGKSSDAAANSKSADGLNQ
jgi:hypothetical protein